MEEAECKNCGFSTIVFDVEFLNEHKIGCPKCGYPLNGTGKKYKLGEVKPYIKDGVILHVPISETP